uniref:Stress-response A/B barrel domain-containing protein n=1 Tax=Salix viminalis TaxID=40686 RepID=A0A6N2NDZ8_SALVM
MEQVVKHIVLAKFKEEVTEAEIQKLISDYADLRNHIKQIKGKDVSIENLNQGFTHIFETTFETLEDRSAYVTDPAHVKFGSELLPALEKVVGIDYVPTHMKGVVKHIVLAKFKEGVTKAEIEKLIKDYADLRNHIKQVKGTDMSIENLNQGFTHIFETTFATLEDRSAYVAHPAHVKFGAQLFPTLEKVIGIDFVPAPEP